MSSGAFTGSKIPHVLRQERHLISMTWDNLTALQIKAASSPQSPGERPKLLEASNPCWCSFFARCPSRRDPKVPSPPRASGFLAPVVPQLAFLCSTFATGQSRSLVRSLEQAINFFFSVLPLRLVVELFAHAPFVNHLACDFARHIQVAGGPVGG